MWTQHLQRVRVGKMLSHYVLTVYLFQGVLEFAKCCTGCPLTKEGLLRLPTLIPLSYRLLSVAEVASAFLLLKNLPDY